MGGLDEDIDRAIVELLKLKRGNYVGIDVQIRKDGATTFWVAANEENLSDSIVKEDVERLEKVLELLEKIDKILEKLKEHENYTEYVPHPCPWPTPYRNPWAEPWITWSDDTTGTPLPKPSYTVSCSFSRP